MNVRWTLLAVGAVGTVVGFLLEAPGPLGSQIWPMAAGLPEPDGMNMTLLMVMGVIEALAFGAGIVFLVAGWVWVKSRTSSPGLAWATYLSVAWLLVNWVPHTSLHMAHGNLTQPSDFGGLVAIEYGFHLTLIIAGLVLATFVMRSAAPSRASTATTAATSTRKTA